MAWMQFLARSLRASSARVARALWLGLALACLASASLPGEAFAQASRGADEKAPTLELYAYSMVHKQAADALSKVQALLSRHGAVELRPGENTLIVRDRVDVINRVAEVLRTFDRPPVPLRLEVLLVEANRAAFSPAIGTDLPEDLVRRLKELLPFKTYRVIAQTDLRTSEDQEVTYEIGAGFTVDFRVGSILDLRRISLVDFKVSSASGRTQKQLIHTSLRLPFERPSFLGLSSQESSARALMIILTPHLEGEAAERWRRSQWAGREPS